MTEEPTQEFRRALLVPIAIAWLCPSCNEEHAADLDEDFTGLCQVPAQDRYVQCPTCDAFVDIGWAGWRHHDADTAQPPKIEREAS